MEVHRIRGRLLRWSAEISALAIFSIGCSALTTRYDFDPRQAHDHTAPAIANPRDAEDGEIVAVLLIPANTTVDRPNFPHSLEVARSFYHEKYVGPARVFLMPGKRRYIVRVHSPDGVVELELEAVFESGKRYELHIVEDSERVAFELFELHPSSYTALYPND
jgi:hypothetical protein